jgi:dihydroorotate dehydrogenase electron transfer subunit
MMVAGGTGMAPLVPLLRHLKDSVVVLGARTAALLLFRNRVAAHGQEVYITTDDGSAGHHGLVTEMLDTAGVGCAAVYTCGPEIMMKKVVDWCTNRNLPVQASLERYMKCGIGICDACALDGRHVCQDGPVFDGTALAEIEDFGNWKRAPSGKRVPL